MSVKVHPVAHYNYNLDSRTGLPGIVQLWSPDGQLRATVRFVDDAAPVPPPTLGTELESGTGFLRSSSAHLLIDMLRNEDTVGVTLNDQPPGFLFIQTGREPVGVGDEDRAARVEQVDQVNDASWVGAAVHVGPTSRASQTVVPTLPRLNAVEAQLQTGNPGQGGDTLTLTVLSSSGRVLGSTTAAVSEGVNGAQRFDLPGGGINVVPGDPLTLLLQDTGKTVFFWRYVGGNPYPRGQAFFCGAAFDTNDFLFRTFGALAP